MYMIGDALPAILSAIPIIFVIWVNIWYFSRSRSVLQQWADENGLEILDSAHRYLFLGPFFLTTSNAQAVYRVRVRDRAGMVRSGWVRCGSLFLGMLTDKAEVRWDDA